MRKSRLRKSGSRGPPREDDEQKRQTGVVSTRVEEHEHFAFWGEVCRRRDEQRLEPIAIADLAKVRATSYCGAS